MRRDVLKIPVSLGPILAGLVTAERASAKAGTETKGAEVVATDRSSKPVSAEAWVAAHPGPMPELVLGPADEPYYLVVRDGALQNFALKAECTHLGCLVAFDVAAGKGFACPCHGSMYNMDGAVTRGPAPRSLSLAEVSLSDDGVVLLAPWSKPDFRTPA